MPQVGETDLTMVAGGTVTKNALVEVDSTANQVTVSNSANDLCIGFAQNAAASGAPVAIGNTPGKVYEGIAAAAITFGAAVQSNGDGKIKTATTAGYPVGVALEAATANNDVIRVLWCPTLTPRA